MAVKNRNDNSKPIVFSPWLEKTYGETDKTRLIKEMGIARGSFAQRFDSFINKKEYVIPMILTLPMVSIAGIIINQQGWGWLHANWTEIGISYGEPCFNTTETDAQIVKECYYDLSDSLFVITLLLAIDVVLILFMLRKYELKRKLPCK